MCVWGGVGLNVFYVCGRDPVLEVESSINNSGYKNIDHINRIEEQEPKNIPNRKT